MLLDVTMYSELSELNTGGGRVSIRKYTDYDPIRIA